MIRLKNLHEEWGKVALVTGINITELGLGQISILASGNLRTIPWCKREHYAEVIVGCRANNKHA